jgi:two-component system, LuxR family, sensor kinase FixL
MNHHKKTTRSGPVQSCPVRDGGAGRRRTPARKTAPGRGPAAWRESEERLRAILQTAVEAIITIDERGIVESMNPAAERVFGWKAEEMVGRSVNLLMPSPYREEHDRYLANYLQTGQAKVIGFGREIVGQRKDGTVFPMDLAVSEVRLAHRRLFTGFIRDITERKGLEREVLEITQRERQRIGQDLHDGLCQQLAAIELMSQVLEQKLASKSKAAAARAGDIARHVRDAIGQTRALARGLSPVTLESEGLTAGLMELAANTEKLFGVRCWFESPAKLVVRSVPVATQLYRIAQEAVSNAIKHGQANRLNLSLQVEGDRLVLRVADNGCGFPPAEPKPGGMGLRIMKYRADIMGGALSVERNPDRGMTISCSVPRAAALAGAPSLS